MRLVYLACATLIFSASTLAVKGFHPHASVGIAQDNDYSEKDVIQKTVPLSAGAKVEIRGINGRVEVDGTDSGQAEIEIVRSARTREDLEHGRIEIETAGNSLVIKGVNEKGWNNRGVNVRQRVTLRVPRGVEMAVSGVNGSVDVDGIVGAQTVSGVNGSVNVNDGGAVTGISGINGKVSLGISRIGEGGMRVSGINGGVEIRVAGSVSADVRATGINGNVTTDVPNAVIEGKVTENNYRARIGGGGPDINVSGINGSVRIKSGGGAS